MVMESNRLMSEEQNKMNICLSCTSPPESCDSTLKNMHKKGYCAYVVAHHTKNGEPKPFTLTPKDSYGYPEPSYYEMDIYNLMKKIDSYMNKHGLKEKDIPWVEEYSD